MMPKFALTLFCLLLLPLSSLGMDLSKFTDSLTRSQADNLFTKDYAYTVLDDISIRREWNKGDQSYILDFLISDEKLTMAEIRYLTPVDSKIAIADANKIAGTKLSGWKKAKTAQSESVGLGNCYYTKSDKGNYYFVEVNKNENAICTIFFSKPPRVNRRALCEAKETSGYSAMGSSSTAGAVTALNEDEYARLNSAAKVKKPSSVATTSQPKVQEKAQEKDVSSTTTVVTVKKVEHVSLLGLSMVETLVILGAFVVALIVIVVASHEKTPPPTGRVPSKSLRK